MISHVGHVRSRQLRRPPSSAPRRSRSWARRSSSRSPAAALAASRAVVGRAGRADHAVHARLEALARVGEARCPACVKSTTTYVGVAEHVAEGGARAPGRRARPAPCPSAPSTASQTVCPIRPAAPETATSITRLRARGRRRQRGAEARSSSPDAGRGQALGRDTAPAASAVIVVGVDRVESLDRLVERQQRDAHQDRARRAGSCAPRSTPSTAPVRPFTFSLARSSSSARNARPRRACAARRRSPSSASSTLSGRVPTYTPTCPVSMYWLDVRVDRVGQAALLAHLLEQARRARAAQDRVEHRAARSGGRRCGRCPGAPRHRWYCSVSFWWKRTVGCFGAGGVAGRRRSPARSAVQAFSASSTNPLVLEVAGRGDDDRGRHVAAVVVGGDVSGTGTSRSPRRGRSSAARAGGRRRPRAREHVVDLVRRLVLVHRDLLDHDLALGLDVRVGRAQHHVADHVEGARRGAGRGSASRPTWSPCRCRR